MSTDFLILIMACGTVAIVITFLGSLVFTTTIKNGHTVAAAWSIGITCLFVYVTVFVFAWMVAP